MIIFENIGGRELLLLFLSPIVGFIIDNTFSKKASFYILLFVGLLFIPFFFGYYYTIPFTYRFLGIIGVGCFFSFYFKPIKTERSKIIQAISLSVILFITIGFSAALEAFAGNRTVEETYYADQYKIEFIKEEGFAGKPLLICNLNEYTTIPLFIKKIETIEGSDSLQKCYSIFPKHRLILNKIDGTLKEYNSKNLDEIKLNCNNSSQ